MALIACYPSSTIASKDMSSCIIGWILTKLIGMIFIWPSTINCLNVLVHCIYVSSSNGLKYIFKLKTFKIHKALSLDV